MTTRPRAAHITVTRADGRHLVTEVFSAEDITSRFAASRHRALKYQFSNEDVTITRYDFAVGSANDPTRLCAAAKLVGDDTRKSFPDWDDQHAVADARANMVLRDADWAPGATVLNGDREDPTYQAYRTVLQASQQAVDFALGRPRLPDSAYCVRCHKDDLPYGMLCGREAIRDNGENRDPSLVARYEGRCLRCCEHNHG